MANLTATQNRIIQVVKAEATAARDVIELYQSVVLQYSLDRQADNIAFFINAYAGNKVTQKRLMKMARKFGKFSYKAQVFKDAAGNVHDSGKFDVINKKVSKREKVDFRATARTFSNADYSSVKAAYEALFPKKDKEAKRKKVSELYAQFNAKLEKLNEEGLLDFDIDMAELVTAMTAMTPNTVAATQPNGVVVDAEGEPNF